MAIEVSRAALGKEKRQVRVKNLCYAGMTWANLSS